MSRLPYLLMFTLSLMMVLMSAPLQAQDDLLDLLEEDEPETNEPVFATFKGTKLINANTIETMSKKALEFRITHRFGNVGTDDGGSHNLWGFDNASNIRFSLDYGLLDNLQVGIGRSKTNEHLDGLVKWRFLTQTTNNKIPISVAVYGSASFTTRESIPEVMVFDKTAHRFTYTAQMIIARKFGSRISLEVLPTYTHRNLVQSFSDGTSDENDLFSVGFAGRVKVTNRLAFVADYFLVTGDRNDIPGPDFQDPLSIGVEIETGGHVFHVNLSNSSGIMENDFIPDTRDSWGDGAYKIGFNISRVFQF